MFTVTIQLNSINAEKLASAIPPNLQFQMNLSLPSSAPQEKKNALIIPFAFTVSSTPPVLQINIRGDAVVSSDNLDEIKNLLKELKNKHMPAFIIQSVFNNLMAETILLCRSLGIPPPIPSLPLQYLKQKKNTNMSYTPVQ